MVKIRLARRGRKKLALYDVVVADARAPRDGRFIEKIGTYNPNVNPAFVDVDTEKAFDWVMKGAQPTDTVRAILSYRGVMMRKHLQIGVIKGAITQEEADKRMAEWMKNKESQIQAKRDKLSKDLADSKKARLEAEAKVKEARAEALKSKNIVEEEVAEATDEAAASETASEETPVAEAAETAEASTEEAEAPAEEPKAEEKEVEQPKAEAKEEPKAEAPVEEAPKAEEPKAEASEEAEEKEESKES